MNEEPKIFELRGDYIELNKLLKRVGWTQTGGHAKIVVQSGEVLRNGEVETRVRAKLVPGDVIEWEGQTLRVSRAKAEDAGS